MARAGLIQREALRQHSESNRKDANRVGSRPMLEDQRVGDDSETQKSHED